MKYGSVCSGVEAASMAWEPLGFEPVFFSEIEPFPSAVLAHHWPSVPNNGDMTKFEEWGYESGDIDVLVGGTPCQSFSVAGLRGGLGDDRGNLALTYMRMVDRLRPRWCVWENVPGVLSSNGGRDFGSIVGALAELGYSCAWRVLDAQNFGVPQRRRRVFLVGCASGDWRDPAKVLFEQSCGTRDFEASRKARKENTGGVAKCLTAHGTRLDLETETFVYESHPSDSRTKEMGDACSTVRARWGTGGGNTPLVLHASNVAPAVTSSGPPYSRTGNERVECDALVAQAIPLDLRNAGRDPEKHDAMNRQGVGVGKPGDPAHTVTTACVHGVAHNMKVRRLTPTEAERLQGFPDGHTDIGWKGKPTPDSHRYKAMGNSMAVPVMRWIGERIKACES